MGMVRRKPNYMKMPAVKAHYEISSDTPPEMQEHIKAADSCYEQISHLIKDEGRLKTEAFMLISLLPDDQMEEFCARLEDIPMSDYEKIIALRNESAGHVNYAWFPHWVASVMPDGERKEMWLHEHAAKVLTAYPLQFADMLACYSPKEIEQYADFFVQNSSVDPALTLVEGAKNITEDLAAKLLIRSGYNADTLSRSKKLLKSEDNLGALILQNLDVEEKDDE